MCGIAGVMMAGGRPARPELLKGFADALAHRGPDGFRTLLRGSVGLMHRRLSIVDLAGGDQPLYDDQDRALIANGEIYNDLELRAGALAGRRFATGSDSETILALYDLHGPEGADRLRGMYAFALHDPLTGVLMLCRDSFGIKPLYYVQTEDLFAFASEPQAFIRSGLIQPSVRTDVAEELLQLQFTTGRRTIFEGVERVLPGETLLIKDARIVERRSRPALPRRPRSSLDEASALAALDDVLMDSVAAHLRSDVPYGLFLSSGVDSSAILHCLRRLSDQPATAYTASFPGTRLADEFPRARRIAEAAGARHVNVHVTEADFWRRLPQIAACVDDPTADYAVVPTFLLAEAAARDVKVVLCGEGGDEIFAGYSRYRRQSLPLWLGGRARRAKGPFSGRDVLLREPRGWRDGVAEAERRALDPARSRLQAAQALDCEESLPDALLTKLDRCLMAHGVEGRTPFLDAHVAPFGFLLPDDLKLKGPRGKYLLRRWLQTRLPEAEPFARKKGFTVPVGEWIARAGAQIGPLVAADPAVEALCRPEAVRRIFLSADKHDQNAAWRLLFFALWHRSNIRGVPPDGDVLDCLTASERSPGRPLAAPTASAA
jgi:asparagine synthase (glutamine-hydrolysing)